MITELIGYTDRISVAPGETIAIKVSTDLDRYDAAIVRLIHGDANGPGFKEEVMSDAGSHAGRKQVAHAGSYGIVEDHTSLALAGGFTLQAWICPTTPQKVFRGLSPSGRRIRAMRWLSARWAALNYGSAIMGKVRRVGSGSKLRARQWYFVAASFDATTGEARLYQTALSHLPQDAPIVVAETGPGTFRPAKGPLTFATLTARRETGSGGRAEGLYNGKIDRPVIVGRALREDEIDALRTKAILAVSTAWSPCGTSRSTFLPAR